MNAVFPRRTTNQLNHGGKIKTPILLKPGKNVRYNNYGGHTVKVYVKGRNGSIALIQSSPKADNVLTNMTLIGKLHRSSSNIPSKPKQLIWRNRQRFCQAADIQ